MIKLVAIGMVALACIPPAQASTRCGRELINPGARLDEVLSRCGPPAAQASQPPALCPNGVPRKGATKTDVLVYGPNGGAWKYWRFQNDVLIRVDTRREAPDGNLL
ncbi:DUF2845 domain-containing protein [Pseudomonas sp. Marseille-Q5115]|uniref:DUF2845 domain-containing protein n=1 Tax=Pseudomonas sp. Marseille-Q5115 TaxID=2866593 RepID=UPI001CE3D9BE|nr:DUF2845 domain-containing protein [Pseudomonas sp. Marseille-Q5115]